MKGSTNDITTSPGNGGVEGGGGAVGGARLVVLAALAVLIRGRTVRNAAAGVPHIVAFLLFAACPAFAAADDTDPYLWLEELGSPRSMAWVGTENAKTTAVLEQDRRYSKYYADALLLAEARDRIPMPNLLAGGIFNFWQDADHVRGIWRRTLLADYRNTQPRWRTVMDIDELARLENANWFSKGFDCVEPGETRCMVLLSDGGEDAITGREFDLGSGKLKAGGFFLPRGKQRLAWESENSLMVAREWNPGELTQSGYPYIVKRLTRGQPLSAAREIFRGSSADGGYGVTPLALHDGSGHSALIIDRPVSTFESEKYLRSSRGNLHLALPLKSQIETLMDGRLLVRIDEAWVSGSSHFPAGALVALDLARTEADPSNLRPELVYAPGPLDSLQSVAASRGALVVTSLRNVSGRASIYTLSGRRGWSSSTLALPDNAAIDLVDSSIHGDIAFLSDEGFLQPASLELVNLKTGSVERVKSLPPKFDGSQDTVEQFSAASSDGTKIPYFVVHRIGMKLDGGNATILYAYGGFQISETPVYSAPLGKLWLEQGGVFVLANLRGGGEFGPAWHEAGRKTHRQLIYDDFAAVARDLIARGITSPRRLGIRGGSNGGLLMGVEFTQHPELWNAVGIEVPLLDMLRFEKIAAGASWVGEYGSVSVPEERAFLARTSPYQNIHRGTRYPEPFIWTTSKDDRVGPQHARKFAARLSEYGIPYFFYEVVEGGHGSGANLKERAHTTALEMTYFAHKLMD